jgi:hypothetical protein
MVRLRRGESSGRRLERKGPSSCSSRQLILSFRCPGTLHSAVSGHGQAAEIYRQLFILAKQNRRLLARGLPDSIAKDLLSGSVTAGSTQLLHAPPHNPISALACSTAPPPSPPPHPRARLSKYYHSLDTLFAVSRPRKPLHARTQTDRQKTHTHTHIGSITPSPKDHRARAVIVQSVPPEPAEQQGKNRSVTTHGKHKAPSNATQCSEASQYWTTCPSKGTTAMQRERESERERERASEREREKERERERGRGEERRGRQAGMEGRRDGEREGERDGERGGRKEGGEETL